MIQQPLPRALILWWWAAVSVSAVLTLVLGPLGFWLYLEGAGQKPSSWEVVYRTLQLFFLNCDALAPGVPASLQAARFLAAFGAFSTVALALLQLFHSRVQLFRLRFFRDHVVVCSLGPTGADLVWTLRQRGLRVVVLEENANHEGIRRCRDAGAVVLIGPGTDEGLLGSVGLGRARVLLTLLRDDAANLRIALLARQLNAARSKGTFHCVAQVTDRDLGHLLLEQDLLGRAADPFQLELFNHYEARAQAMVQQALTVAAESKPQRWLLVGLGQLGEALLLRAARNWLIDGAGSARHQVLILDRRAAECETRLRRNFLFLERACDLEFVSVDVLGAPFTNGEFLSRGGQASPIDMVFICLSNEAVALLAAARLSKLLDRPPVPIILGMEREAGLGTLIQAKQTGQVRVVGWREVLSSPALVLDATREALAQAIHERYLRDETARGATPAGNAGLVPWHELPEDLKNSNRDQAGDIPVKLRTVGCRLAVALEEMPRFIFTEKEVQQLAPMEHERWCAERRRSGWQYGPTKDMARRLHPSLVGWDQLDDVDKDRDRSAIRHIPILVARAGYAIVRDGPLGGPQPAPPIQTAGSRP